MTGSRDRWRLDVRGGQDWRVRYRIEAESHTVVVLDVSHRSDTYGS